MSSYAGDCTIGLVIALIHVCAGDGEGVVKDVCVVAYQVLDKGGFFTGSSGLCEPFQGDEAFVAVVLFEAVGEYEFVEPIKVCL